jgi:hypothetical protein
MPSRASSCLLVLGLLTSCRQTGPARSATPVVSSSPATLALEPAPKPTPIEPALTLSLTADGWSRGSLTERAISTAAPTRGGYERLNRMADDLRAVAAHCRCTSQPIKLAVDDQVPGWQLLSVLGLLNVAGFSQVQVEHQAESLRFELGRSAAPGATLRILGSNVFLAEAKVEATANAVAQLCGTSGCEGATLSVAEEAELDVWWRAARIAAGPDRARPVRLLLDAQPRPPIKLEPAGPTVRPIATIAVANIQKRVMAEYAALYTCLIKFPLPVPAEPNTPLAFDLSIGADGVTQSVAIVDAQAPTEATSCLRSAFQAMVFHAPNFGATKLRYPFARGER